MSSRRATRGTTHAAACLLLTLLATACTAHRPPAQPAASNAVIGRSSAPATAPEVETAAALIAIAQRFNDNYAHNDDGPVWDRFDIASQAIITRADYLHRHAECPTAPQAPAHVDSAVPGPHGAWAVHYDIGGIQFTDYWFYLHGRWRFDLPLSNPHAVTLYRMSRGDYAAATGCTHS